MKNSTLGAYSKMGVDLNKTKTPAVTRVAACNRGETGVGGDIAKSNKVCSPSWAVLAEGANKKQIIIQLRVSVDK